MSTKWPMVRLGEVLWYRKEFITIDDLKLYKRPRVKLHVQGIVLRDEILGAVIKTKQQQLCHAGEFLVAEIDAKVGGFGIVPQDLDGAIVSSHYFLFTIDEEKVNRHFLGWFIQTADFREQVEAQGSTNYAAIRPSDVLGYQIPLPSLDEQQRIVVRIEEVAAQLDEARTLTIASESDSNAFLNTVFLGLIKDTHWLPMSKAAPLVRRPVEIQYEVTYPDLGIRSFGKGSFHKLTLTGLEIGSKRLYRIEPGDLVFNNVFAREGAVVVAKPEDAGRFGYHRFITCVPKKDFVTAEFLRFYFLTDEGLQKLGEASPGGAGRNRTLGLDALSKIEVPIPEYIRQLWFDKLRRDIGRLKRSHDENIIELNALLPSILDKAYKGDS